jgi:hypothetical protein
MQGGPGDGDGGGVEGAELVRVEEGPLVEPRLVAPGLRGGGGAGRG